MWVWVLLNRSSCGNPCDGFGSTMHVLVLVLLLQFLGRPRGHFLPAILKRCFSNSRPSPAYTPGLEVLLVPTPICYGVKVKSCVALAPEIFTDEGAGSWVAYIVVGVWPEP